MASCTLTADRRSFLAAAPAAVLAAAGAASTVMAATSRTHAWDVAHARWQRAKAIDERHWAIVKLAPGPISGSLSDRAQALGEEHSNAQAALMETPAPNLQALKVKLDIAFDPDSGDEFAAGWSISYLAQTISDYHRLLGAA